MKLNFCNKHIIIYVKTACQGGRVRVADTRNEVIFARGGIIILFLC